MKCPKCDVTLAIADRQGIEIDYCPQCRGVWLDRGELDKIIERTAGQLNQSGDDDDRRRNDRDDDRHRHSDRESYRRDDDYYREGYGKHGKHYKKKSLLDDLFDF